MSKEYEVKFSEIFPMPQTKADIDMNLDENGENVNVEESDPNETDNSGENSTDKPKTPEQKESKNRVHCSENEEVALLDKDNQQSSSTRPPKRLAALRSRAKLKDIISCLHTEETSGTHIKTKPPTHGWNYDDWIKDIDDDPYYEVAEGLVDSVIDTTNNLVDDDELISPPPTPFQQLLDSLATNSPCLPQTTERAQLSMGLLQVFPPVDEDEEMVWDDTTTPPELVHVTEDQLASADRQLNDALQPVRLFDTADDDNFLDLTSEDSIDDVFEDDSILEVTIDGTRRFRRQNAFRRKLPVQIHGTEGATSADDEDSTADDIEIENNKDEDAQVETDVPTDATPNSRPKRNIQKIDYAIYNGTGKKKK